VSLSTLATQTPQRGMNWRPSPVATASRDKSMSCRCVADEDGGRNALATVIAYIVPCLEPAHKYPHSAAFLQFLLFSSLLMKSTKHHTARPSLASCICDCDSNTPLYDRTVLNVTCHVAVFGPFKSSKVDRTGVSYWMDYSRAGRATGQYFMTFATVSLRIIPL